MAEPAKTLVQQDIREYYLQILFKRKKVFFTPLICFLFLSVLACIFVPREYEASTTILVEEKATLSGAIKGIVVATPLSQRIRTIREEILSWSRILEVVRELGMDVGIANPKELEKLITKVQKKIYVRQKGSDVIQIAYRGKDASLVQNFVNTITQKYIEKNLKSERQQTYSAIDFLEEQLDSYTRKIKETQKNLTDFRSKNISSLSLSADVLFEEMVKRQMEVETLNLEILNLQEQIDAIDRQLSGEDKLVITESVEEMNPVIAELKTRLVGLQTQLSSLRLKYTDKHPSVIETIRLIELTQQQIESEGRQVTTAEKKERNPIYMALIEQKERMLIKLRNLKSRQNSLEEIVAQQEVRIQNIPKTEQRLAELTRDVEVNTEMYDQLLARMEQAKISQQLEATDRGARFEVLDPARLPQVPVGPSIPKFIFIGLFLGLASGGGMLYLGELLDHSFRGVSDATQYLDLPILGTIPAIVTQRDLARETRTLVVLVISIVIFMIVATFVMAWIGHLMIKYNLG